MSIVTSSCGCSPDRHVGAGTTGVSLYARTWLLADALANGAPGATRAQRGVFVELMMIQIAAAVRHAITLRPTAARQLLAMFKRTLPRDLAVLDA
ncbi:hypothetical protein WT41_12535 [Burkholderia territorii]|uniref:hypothetical protein n=1 Tax=Burkholderia territorii TaxID=1503055 RepID=UPI000754BC37|nr:hypothetical protein [Burkholderia territorii]KWA19132.1 hypothetical protein WT38_24280 [Burkholderia territorii]KWA45332.1 hypothetical protein WT41_12535 [Burkholderia territorii]